MLRAAVLLYLLLAAPVAARDILLNSPIDCDLTETCFIQQYVDRDEGPGAADHTCGLLSYDGHTGTDFALPSLAMMAAGVNVVASAPGTVRAFRDGMEDITVSTPGAPSVEGKECGNGVVIDHGGGWETQYCHMRKGSIVVRDGQRVAKGAVLGQVGLSGDTEFPHVHLTVRHDGVNIDPFHPDQTLICGEPAATTLWQTPPAHQPGGLITLGFATAVPEFSAVKEGLPQPDSLPATAPALVLWAYAFGGKTGDVVEITIEGPDRTVIVDRSPVTRTQAQFFRAAGKKMPAGGWPAGAYSGLARLLRQDEVIDSGTVTLTVTP